MQLHHQERRTHGKHDGAQRRARRHVPALQAVRCWLQQQLRSGAVPPLRSCFASISRALQLFSFRGKCSSSIYMLGCVQAVAAVPQIGIAEVTCWAVAVVGASQEMRVYNESTLLSTTVLKDHPSGLVRACSAPQMACTSHAAAGVRPLRKGGFDCSHHAQGWLPCNQGLVTPQACSTRSKLAASRLFVPFFRSILLTPNSPLQIMSRQSNLSKGAAVTGPPAEQDMPLDIPKKSKLSIEQVCVGAVSGGRFKTTSHAFTILMPASLRASVRKSTRRPCINRFSRLCAGCAWQPPAPSSRRCRMVSVQASPVPFVRNAFVTT
jgi:hypothetical protein